jgi:hypothetical protein
MNWRVYWQNLKMKFLNLIMREKYKEKKKKIYKRKLKINN